MYQEYCVMDKFAFNQEWPNPPTRVLQNINADTLKSFLRSSLLQVRKETIEECKEAMGKMACSIGDEEHNKPDGHCHYAVAIDELISKLSELGEKQE